MNRCTKPDKKGALPASLSRFSNCLSDPSLSVSSSPEFLQICRAVGMGFVVMGFIGYFVKLIHIPINHVVSLTAPNHLLDTSLTLPSPICASVSFSSCKLLEQMDHSRIAADHFSTVVEHKGSRGRFGRIWSGVHCMTRALS